MVSQRNSILKNTTANTAAQLFAAVVGAVFDKVTQGRSDRESVSSKRENRISYASSGKKGVSTNYEI